MDLMFLEVVEVLQIICLWVVFLPSVDWDCTGYILGLVQKSWGVILSSVGTSMF